jgi:nitrite reductase/ring-hydroxylating ferredoxin subunit
MFVDSGLKESEIFPGSHKVVRKNAKQVLVLAHDGRLYAIANRCPHEGYPLSEGTLGPGCTLTCNWHNWKFDLSSGDALIGRDPVRIYPVEIRNGAIFIDLADPPAEAQRKRALIGLAQALADNDTARIAREVARLERAGFAAESAIVEAIAALNERWEAGFGHAHAACPDWLALAAQAPDPDARLAALIEPLEHLAWDALGARHFPYATGVMRWNEDAFLAATEREDEPAAIARIRGAVADGMSYARLRPTLGRAALAHYADFGHSAIYTLKAGQLLARLGDEILEPVLVTLVRSLVQATREERLPEFRFYAKALAAWNDAGYEPARMGDLIGLPVEALLKRVLLSSGRPKRELFDALLGAAAWNLAHFNIAIDRATDNPIADNIGWLDFTHALTFANAARQLAEQDESLWPQTLLQMALFVGRNAGYVAPDEDLARWDPQMAANAFIEREKSTLYDHGIVEPIISCHRLKVLFALEQEIASAPDAPWVALTCTAVNRYLHVPMKRRHSLRLAAQARDFIAKEG